jgi:hypothetical protein
MVNMVNEKVEAAMGCATPNTLARDVDRTKPKIPQVRPSQKLQQPLAN